MSIFDDFEDSSWKFVGGEKLPILYSIQAVNSWIDKSGNSKKFFMTPKQTKRFVIDYPRKLYPIDDNGGFNINIEKLIADLNNFLKL